MRKDAGWPLRDAMRRVAEADEGVVVILCNQIGSRDLVKQVMHIADAPDGDEQSLDQRTFDWRRVGLGAQILADIGVQKMRVMSNPRKYHAISGFGLEVVEYVN